MPLHSRSFSFVRLAPFVAGLVCLTAAADVYAQSLGDVARREEERRKGVAAPGKVYTGDKLKPEVAPAVPPASATTPASPPAASSAAPDAKPDDGKKDEKYWRDRIQGERDALQRAQVFADALQSRVNALSSDFVARDDPAQRAVIGTDRQKALAELDRIKREIEQRTKAIATIQDEARRAGVPAGWVR